MSAFRPISFATACAALLPTALFAAEIFVNGTNGSDSNDGQSATRALATLQAAEKIARAGDTITVARGVYYGPIELKKLKGTAENPVTLRAESRERGAVVITNADPALREGRAKWERVDETPGLWRAPFAREAAARVLVSGADLQPFTSLDDLKTFTATFGEKGGKMPTAEHGFFHDVDAGQLYVRLHASGKYGEPDPRRHVVSAGTRTGAGSAGTGFDGPHYYNLGLMERGAAHIVVEGFTFETPGFSGVHVNGSNVIVRDCWFLGCRAGVTGRKENADPRQTSNAITVEHCDYTQFPAFDDAEEVMLTRKPAPGAPRYPLFWWSRKGYGGGNKRTYETGIVALVGGDWILRNNRIHNSFEGISTWSLRWAKNLRIEENVFEKIVDNAIEMEDHAAGMLVRGNWILDTIEPLSWQPLGGEPWPGPVFVFGNVIRNHAALNRRVAEISGHRPGWFKAGAQSQNWTAPWNRERMKAVPQNVVRAPGAGVVVFNNTVVFPEGNFLTLTQPHERRFENFYFVNNLVAAQAFSAKSGYRAADMVFKNNVWLDTPSASSATGNANVSAENFARIAVFGGGEIFAGADGKVLPMPPALPMQAADLSAPDSRASMGKEISAFCEFAAPFKAIAVPEAAGVLPAAERASFEKYIGAIPHGENPQMPAVGPRTNAK